MRKIQLSIAALLFVSACQTGEVSYNSAILAESVYVTDAAVATTGPTLEVVAQDCRHELIGDSDPTASMALTRLKSEAAQAGFNAIHSVSIESSGAAAVFANCWSQIVARGIAYNR